MGGFDNYSEPSKSTFLLDGNGRTIHLPDLDTAKASACAAIENWEPSKVTIAVIGGYLKHKRLKTVERYECQFLKGLEPKCNKMANGPELNYGKGRFGCGTLTSLNGAKVLLALRDAGPYKQTEALDLSR